MTKINPALRSWTRGVSFTLAMGKTQVAILVSLHLSQNRPYWTQGFIGQHHKSHQCFISAIRALHDRGLIDDAPGAKVDRSGQTVGQIWTITPAGEHVVALLKITGIYDELRAEFEQADAAWRVRIA